MPLHLTGSVTLRVDEDEREVEANAFTCIQAGLRVRGTQCPQHEFIYRYQSDSRFELLLNATANDDEVALEPLSIERKAPIDVSIVKNSLEASFNHDPDLDDEPLTPVSTS